MKNKGLLLAWVLGAALVFVGGWSAATQYCASSFRYHPVLGRRVVVFGTPCFAPWAWLGWERLLAQRRPQGKDGAGRTRDQGGRHDRDQRLSAPSRCPGRR
jgi:hypothetical protein